MVSERWYSCEGDISLTQNSTSNLGFGAARQYKSTGNLLRIQKGPTTWFPNSHFPVTLRRWLQADTIIRLYTDRQAKTENHFRFC